jgi:homoserine O-acetyltransferase/O-succinyltransferase
MCKLVPNRSDLPTSLVLAAIFLVASARSQTAPSPSPLLGYTEGTYTIKDFRFRSGEILRELHLAYVTIGTPRRDGSGHIRNAVLLLHGTGDSHETFLEPGFSKALYGLDQPLDLQKYYLVIPDCVGHGKSSKPSNGMRASFPKYGYEDMVAAEHRLVTEGLGIDHLRLIMGDSMGGMHTWLWGIRYPEMMDGLVPMGSYPVEIAGRNWLWRKVIIEAIRNDPDWNNGNYEKQPRSWAAVKGVVGLMVTSPVYLQAKYPTRKSVNDRYEQLFQAALKDEDANDELYAYAASSDYNPQPELEKIKAKLLAINFADDEVNPPQLRIFEREMPRVKNGRFVIVPATDGSNGHLNFGRPELWQKYLRQFLASLNGD